SALLYSTYVGGGGLDDAAAIAVDSAGAVYIAGDTQSNNFPLINPLQSSLAGTQDAFVSKINAAGSALVYSTYFAGSGVDYGRALKLDSSGRAFVAGFPSSPDLSLASAIQTHLAGANDLFLATVNAQGTGLDFSTYYGSSIEDQAHGLALDASGNIWIGGH